MYARMKNVSYHAKVFLNFETSFELCSPSRTQPRDFPASLPLAAGTTPEPLVFYLLTQFH